MVTITAPRYNELPTGDDRFEAGRTVFAARTTAS
jgi:hypothetical protein